MRDLIFLTSSSTNSVTSLRYVSLDLDPWVISLARIIHEAKSASAESGEFVTEPGAVATGFHTQLVQVSKQSDEIVCVGCWHPFATAPGSVTDLFSTG